MKTTVNRSRIVFTAQDATDDFRLGRIASAYGIGTDRVLPQRTGHLAIRLSAAEALAYLEAAAPRNVAVGSPSASKIDGHRLVRAR